MYLLLFPCFFPLLLSLLVWWLSGNAITSIPASLLGGLTRLKALGAFSSLILLLSYFMVYFHLTISRSWIQQNHIYSKRCIQRHVAPWLSVYFFHIIMQVFKYIFFFIFERCIIDGQLVKRNSFWTLLWSYFPSKAVLPSLIFIPDNLSSRVSVLHGNRISTINRQMFENLKLLDFLLSQEFLCLFLSLFCQCIYSQPWF